MQPTPHPAKRPDRRNLLIAAGAGLASLAVGGGLWWISSHNPFSPTTVTKPTPTIKPTPVPTCTPSSVSKAISKEGLIRSDLLQWGTDPGKDSTSVAGYAPYAFYDGNGDIIGFEVDVAQVIARLMDVNPKCYPTKYHINIENDLQAENMDIILSGWEITDRRQQDETFSVPYYRYSQQLVVRANDEHFSEYNESSQIELKDLKPKNYTFGTGASYKAADILRDAKLQLYTSDEPIDDLDKGKVDIIMVDTPIVAYFIKGIKGKGKDVTPSSTLRPIGKPLFPNGDYVIGIKKSSPRAQKLQQEIDQALQILKQDGTLKRIYNDWGLWNEFQTSVNIIDCV